MHRDPRNYVEPDSFVPERYMAVTADLSSNELFTEGHWTFGFGRRICPARYLASKMVFIAAIRMLWAFDFKPLLDENGQAMKVDKFDCPWEPVK
jgi:cytochrome P450